MAYREKGRSWGNGLTGEGQFLGNDLTKGVRPHKESFPVYRNVFIMEMAY